MSAEKNDNEAKRWFDTAVDDLQTAHILFDNKKFAQCCFHCQQAAEKAIKAIYYYADSEPWGHAIYKLIQEMPDQTAGALLRSQIDHAKRLDQFYIPTRYPNGLPGTIPSESYGAPDAQSALEASRQIITTVKNHLGY